MREIFADVYRFSARWIGDKPELHYDENDMITIRNEMAEIAEKHKAKVCVELLIAIYNDIERRRKNG